MGFCGCMLYGSTVTAGILTLLDCVLFLTFDVLVIVFLSVKDHWIVVDDTNFTQFIQGFKHVKEPTIVIILIGIKVGLRIVWFISGILLLIGNAREYRKFVNVWKYLTIIRIVFTIATSIYALVSIVGEISDLFNGNHKWNAYQDGKVANFVVLIDFLELGPIWLIILIALAIYVHQRSLEIDTKKRRNMNLWTNSGNLGNNYSNGSARNGNSAIAHPVSLTQEPNPFTINPDNNPKIPVNNNFVPNGGPNHSVGPKVTLEPTHPPKPSTNEQLKPILEINGVISIPRVTLNHSKAAPNKFDSNHENKRHVSSLAKRSSYFEFERDANKIPKRNHSYNIAQTSGQKSYSYDNRAFDSRTENDVYKPVLIKRASTRRSQNQNN